VVMSGAGLRPIGKPLDLPPYPTIMRALHFYPDSFLKFLSFLDIGRNMKTRAACKSSRSPTAAVFMIVMLALVSLPAENADAAPVTYNFQVDAGNAVAITIITDDHVCNNNPLGATITLMSTAAHGCALHVIKPSTAGPQNILDVWFNTPYAVGTAVTGPGG